MRWLAAGLIACIGFVPLGIGMAATRAQAAEILVAVAANFTQPAQEIATAFKAATGHTATLSFGPTGQLYAQIAHGAPFQVLLAADRATITKAGQTGLAVRDSAFTYAVGRLVLYAKDDRFALGQNTLVQGGFARLAIANPELAPYGAAAMQVLRRLGVDQALAAKLVIGNSIAQTWQFVETGNAELGLVALSQTITQPGGAQWLVPDTLHDPIAQDAALLAAGRDNRVAQAFLTFLRGATAQAIITRYGYAVGGE